MAWMKHFQGNFSWAPCAGEGGLAFVGCCSGVLCLSENMNSDLLQTKNLYSNTSRDGELTIWGWLCLLKSSCY